MLKDGVQEKYSSLPQNVPIYLEFLIISHPLVRESRENIRRCVSFYLYGVPQGYSSKISIDHGRSVRQIDVHKINIPDQFWANNCPAGASILRRDSPPLRNSHAFRLAAQGKSKHIVGNIRQHTKHQPFTNIEDTLIMIQTASSPESPNWSHCQIKKDRYTLW